MTFYISCYKPAKKLEQVCSQAVNNLFSVIALNQVETNFE